jgi:hypothetical protein
MRIAKADPGCIRELWACLEPELIGQRSLEGAAQVLASALFARFTESVVLARVFVTIPYGRLPGENQRFVDRLAAGARERLVPETPVLSLIGTRGVESAWNDRRASRGHVGIPLLSASFVRDIPMIAALLKELGLPMDWADDADRDLVDRVLGSSTGLFHVGDAATDTDAAGRKIIPDQTFVAQYGVRSVFGAGGAYFGGMILVGVVFCREFVPRDVAQRFTGLVNFFKGRTTALAAPPRIFASVA